MHSNLLQQAFEKAQETISSDKPTHLSRHLSDYILEDSHEPFGEKSLRNYYKRIFLNQEVCLKPYVVESLCHYLGYNSYEAYVVNIPKKKMTKRKISKKSIIAQAFMLAFMAFLFLICTFSHKRNRRPICELLNDYHTDIEDYFLRLERIMRYMQREAA
ncbi:hypothetical protein M0G43_08610 [Subsaxibacter sp. CAU 1640]|uniref:hypothetical protein n=1 Tax=Subsaxibacter sp. CAU 1640 TaxID=2933271 RepID=UPI002002AC28|nr:hypothetical protein [Subsaxibacter sp. CAU 1640]MCK7590632.1 hypothetical protein [Subsaxibacter sp. CAU 1640]